MTIPTLHGRDIAELLAPQGPRRQHLPGFDADYADIVDYIIRCTHRIWEQKDLGLIETHYGADCPVHTGTGTVAGVETVIAGTTKTLAAFPDRTLTGEAVIWSDEGEGAYYSSHRITSHATNLGPSEFGPPTGAHVVFTTIADCLCRENRIVEEWLVRDNSAIALQLGFSPRTVARAQAEADRAAGPADWRRAALDRVRSRPATPFPSGAMPDPEAEPEAFAAWYFDTVLDHRRFTFVRDAYAPNARLQAPAARRLIGHGEITGWLAALLGTFPDARLSLDHLAVVRGEVVEVAARWTLAGTHSGAVLYGAPSGREVYILGVTHWRIAGGRIRDEVTIFDEIALLRQIEGGL